MGHLKWRLFFSSEELRSFWSFLHFHPATSRLLYMHISQWLHHRLYCTAALNIAHYNSYMHVYCVQNEQRLMFTLSLKCPCFLPLHVTQISCFPGIYNIEFNIRPWAVSVALHSSCQSHSTCQILTSTIGLISVHINIVLNRKEEINPLVNFCSPVYNQDVRYLVGTGRPHGLSIEGMSSRLPSSNRAN